MDDTQERIGESVRALSAAFRDRQEDLAAALNVSQFTISRKFRGLTPWKVEDLQVISARYGVTLDQLTAGPRAWLGIESGGGNTPP
ncbi:helix-turn-helix domain-containing protein [Kitasatospora sp. NPDC057198]|uniref:helix-turn-helix domain-containing protein n=1 Tax=Kitasatospora sp. NPDC057198 TaxID=3346046 RepID=UPI00364247B3